MAKENMHPYTTVQKRSICAQLSNAAFTWSKIQ